MPLLGANPFFSLASMGLMLMNPIIDSTIASSTALHLALSRPASSHTTPAADSAYTDDCVRLTQQATYLNSAQRALESTPPLDTARLESLRQAVADGSYPINPQAIAQRMLELDGQLAR